MSTAPAEVTPGSESSPEPSGSRPEPSPSLEPPPRRMRVWILAGVVALVIAVVVVFFVRGRHAATGTISVSISEQPDHILRLKGTTEAVQARAILAPLLAGQQIGTLTIIHLAPNGAKVNQGDLLVQFD